MGFCFKKGDVLKIRPVPSGLRSSAPACKIKRVAWVRASEDGCSGGWDVYDGMLRGGGEMSFYGFQIERKRRAFPKRFGVLVWLEPLNSRRGRWWKASDHLFSSKITAHDHMLRFCDVLGYEGKVVSEHAWRKAPTVPPLRKDP